MVAASFEEARAAARLLAVESDRAEGCFVLAAESANAGAAPDKENGGPDAPDIDRVGDFEVAFRGASVRLDRTYTTSHESHAMMEPHATMAAALCAKATGRPVKVAPPRALIYNNGTHRSATIQRVRLAAGTDGRLTAISHLGLRGNFPGGAAEMASSQTKLL